MKHKFSSDLIYDWLFKILKNSVLQTRKTPKCHLFCKTGHELKVKGWPYVEKVAATILALSANTYSFALQWAERRQASGENERRKRCSILFPGFVNHSRRRCLHSHFPFSSLKLDVDVQLRFLDFLKKIFSPNSNQIPSSWP